MDFDNFPNPTKRIHALEPVENKYSYTDPPRYLIPPKNKLRIQFSKVLNNRRSIREFNRMKDEDLHKLLWFAAHTQSSFREDGGYIWQHRASPSAGGRHPIDIIICKLEQSPIVIFADLYDSASHSLRRLKTDRVQLVAFWTNVTQALEPQDGTVLWFVAQPERTLSKYENGNALLLLDAGALISTFSFVASALGLNCCAVGCTGDPWITDALDGQGKLIGTTGLVIGSPRKGS